ncbi:MAG: Holliday junction resolvase Hjc [Desulfurococcaceae archaeon]
MSKSRIRGFSHERDLARKLWDHGLAVIRAPASGSKGKKLLYPDIVAIYKGKVIAVEVKTMKKAKTLYIDSYQVRKVLEFVERAGGEAYVAVKIIGSGEWIFIPVSKLEKTGNNNYKLRKESLSEGIRLEALVSIMKGLKKLADFTSRD